MALTETRKGTFRMRVYRGFDPTYAVTADAVVNLPVTFNRRLSPYALAGDGRLIFHPTGNRGSAPGADTQAKGAFLYGVGADYVLTRHFSLRGEYRGFVYKNPDFGIEGLNTDSWTHTAQPSAGVVYRF